MNASKVFGGRRGSVCGKCGFSRQGATTASRSGDSPPLTSGKWDCSCATSYRDMEQYLNIKLYLTSVILLKVNVVK